MGVERVRELFRANAVRHDCGDMESLQDCEGSIVEIYDGREIKAAEAAGEDGAHHA